jgi:hypothetical protein
MTQSLPPTAVIRVSRGNFDPARFEEVNRMANETGTYLIPAIQKLPGLLSYYAAISPSGSMVHVSLWDSEEHAEQMSRLKEMIVDARRDSEAVGVTFIPIVNYPISWTI